MVTKLVLVDLGNTLIDYHSGGLSDDEKDLIGLHRMYSYLSKIIHGLTYSSLHDKFYRPWLRAQAHRPKKLREYDIKVFLRPIAPVDRLTDRQYKHALLKLHSPYIQFGRSAVGAEATLQKLRGRGLNVGLIANTPVPGFCHDSALAALNLLPWFNFRIYSYDVGIRKPDQRIFQLALDRGAAMPESALLIGDSDRLDLLPAHKMGIQAIKFECRELLSASDNRTSVKFPRLKRFEEILDFLR